MSRRRGTAAAAAALLLALAGCGDGEGPEVRDRPRDPEGPAIGEPRVERDLAEIRERDTLEVLTTYNSTGYFIYRGETMGFEHDLLRRFAEAEGLEIRFRVLRDRGALLDSLNAGAGDVVAARMIPSQVESEAVAFTDRLYRTRPVLVQREAPPRRADVPEAVDTVLEAGPGLPDSIPVRARLIRNPAGLAGDTVHLPEVGAFRERLVELSDSLTGDIAVVELEGTISSEAVMRAVAGGRAELTVAPEGLAELRESYYTNLVVRPTLDSPHRVAWAVRRNSPDLLARLNGWIEEEREDGTLEALYEKYYVDRKGYRERLESDYLSAETGRLSEYDALFRDGAGELGWDWRLLASQAFQESRFDPDAVSWAGAGGLLQLMPATAEQYGVDDRMDPEENVEGAVRHLEYLSEMWERRVPDPRERLKFVFASYNAGQGHVFDAQRLAAKHGGDPSDWDDVAYWLLQMSKRSVYTDPVVEHGFVRGMEPVTYVSRIFDRFEHYRDLVHAPGNGENA